jgi:hypothetical protein
MTLPPMASGTADVPQAGGVAGQPRRTLDGFWVKVAAQIEGKRLTRACAYFAR